MKNIKDFIPILRQKKSLMTKGQLAIAFSHIGNRFNHEDNFLLNEVFIGYEQQKRMCNREVFVVRENGNSKVRLFAVSDGMGGHNAGEVASRICMEELVRVHKELQFCNSLNEAVKYLRNGLIEINKIVCDISHKKNECKGMGATLLIFVSFETKYVIFNIGDSRAYYFDNDSLRQITKDHTIGQRMLDCKALTMKECNDFPYRKALERYMGFEGIGHRLKADEFYLEFQKGIILLCSDGISDFIPDMRICEILSKSSSIEEMGKAMINEAVNKHDSDNATVILVPFGR